MKNYSAYSVFIEWESPLTPNGIVIIYTVYVDYNNGSYDDFNVSAVEKNFTLEKLYPYQLIGINLSASTIAGEGPISTTVFERTSQTRKQYSAY